MSERYTEPRPAGQEDGFLSRWSRRKREAGEDTQVEVGDGQAKVDPVQNSPAQPEPPPLTDADMPAIDSLDEGSDYSGFLSPGVSEELRQLALRKLFRSAAFNVTDGLDDYAEDFTSFQALGDIVTREMRVRDALDQAREKAKAALADTDAPAVADRPEPAEGAVPDDAVSDPQADTEQQASLPEEPTDEQLPEST